MLPVAISFGRPSRAEIFALAGIGVIVASAATWIGSTQPAPQPAEAAVATAPLAVGGRSGGATIMVDGRDRGSTPATLSLPLGRHDLVVRAQGAIDEPVSVDLGTAGASIDVDLLRDHPPITYLKPPLPGATVGDARFVDDGRVALQVVLPDGEREAWTLDPAKHLALQRLGVIAPHAMLAVRPDGAAIAYLQARPQAPDSPASLGLGYVPATELWLARVDASAEPHRVWMVPEAGEELVDLTWAPDEKHLIVVGKQPVTGGAPRTTIRWLETTSGEAQALALLPSEVAPGTYVWSPDSQTVAFVVHTASLSAVCTLSVAGDFRYLGDLGHDGLAGPPVAPVAWAPDSRVLYGALVGQTPAAGGSSPFSQNPAGLFLTDPAEAPGRPFSSTAALAPLWRPDGRIFAVGLPGGQDTGLRLRALDPNGEAQDVATINVPAPGPTSYGVRWDLARSRALVVTNRATGDGPAHDYWLVDFGWSSAP